MPVVEIGSEAEFKRLIDKPLTVCDWYATWCGPCKAIAPRIDQLSTKYPNVTFIKVDVDKHPDLAAKYTITAMPTFLFFAKGSKVDEVVGASVADIERKIVSRNVVTSYGGAGRTLGSGVTVAAPVVASPALASPVTMTNAFVGLVVVYLFYKIIYKFIE